MMSAIGTTPASATAYPTGMTTAGIEAQIARYQKELSDCVNCASANTPEGKAKIEAISSKISTAEARIAQVTTNKQAHQPAASSETAANSRLATIYAAELAVERKSTVDSASTLNSSDTTTGSRVDIFA